MKVEGEFKLLWEEVYDDSGELKSTRLKKANAPITVESKHALSRVIRKILETNEDLELMFGWTVLDHFGKYPKKFEMLKIAIEACAKAEED
jgi:hypothetical protein